MASTRLTILLGAGSTITAGAPSTQDLTTHVCRIRRPLVVRMGTPYLLALPLSQEGREEPLRTSNAVPVCKLILDALNASYKSVNFEVVIHALEQLQSFAQAQNIDAHDNFRSVLSAFLEAARKHEILLDANLLSEARRAVMEEILTQIGNKLFCVGPKPEQQLSDFFTRLTDHFDLSVFTLNYDDLADRTGNWFDGFTIPCDPDSTPTPWGFDRRGFIERCHTESKVLLHMHGSTRFGYSPRGDFDLVKYDDASKALDSFKYIRQSDKTENGNIISGTPIISGFNKVMKLTGNPVPYGYYYQALVAALLQNPRLLVVGYGGADPHINTWLGEFVRTHNSNRRVVWVSRMEERDCFEQHRPDRVEMSFLAGGHRAFREHYAYDNGDHFQEHGALRLVPSGFPFQTNSILDKIIAYFA